MRCASFFAGVGGIDLGFQKAGFEIVYANEIDSNAVKTYNLNHMVLADNRVIESIINLDDIPDFDVMLAGFPCQAFSVAGKRQGFNDVGRGDLFFELIRILKAKKPKVIFLENVKNLVSHDNGDTFKVIQQSLAQLGYHLKFKILNAFEYGNIPQNRERIYIVGFLDKTAFNQFEFPEKIPLTTKILDFLEPENSISDKYYYRENVAFFNQLSVIDNADTLYQWRRKYVRTNKSNLCPTLTANMGTGGHNVPLLNVLGRRDTVRKLTPRECFNLQGFPSDFILPDISDCHLYKQAGNSVVVPVIYTLSRNLMVI